MKDSSKTIPGEDRFRLLAVNIITALFLVAAIPAAFAIGDNAFDEGWKYFLNFARKDEYVFGRDILFTYGPLGFLTCVRSVGNRLVLGVAIWLMLYAVFTYLLLQVRQLLLRRKGSLIGPATAAFLFLLPQRLAPDVLVSFYVWLAIALLIDCDRKDRMRIAYALIADLLVAVAFLWKTSAFTTSLATCILAILLLAFIRHEHGKALLLALALPLAPCAYLLYNPSPFDLLRYCKSTLESSSGYTILGNVMTTEPFTAFFVVVGVAAGIYLAVQLWGRDKKSFALFLPFFLPLFLYYKYGITRHGGYAFYQGVCMAFSIFLLFGIFDFIIFPEKDTDRGHLAQRRARLGRVSLGYVLALCVLEFPAFLVSIPTNLKDSTLGLPSEVINNYLSSVRAAGGKSLDQRFKEIVGDSSIAIFPDELLYLTDDSVRFKVMPTVQNNMTFTAWLDRENAASFSGGNAPDFVLFGLETLDMRLPMIESPATYMAIRENYTLAASNGTELLFKKKPGSSAGTDKRLLSRETWTGDPVARPDRAGYLSIEMKPSLAGKLSEFLWKALPVFMDISFDDGSANGGRIVPRTAVTPIAVDDLLIPYSGVHPREDGAADLLAQVITGKPGKKAVSVDFRMKGLVRLYYKNIQICWWE